MQKHFHHTISLKRIIRAAAFFLLVFSSNVIAQELNCQVTVLSPQIQGTTEKRIFDNLQKALYEFMNNTKWTNDNFQVTERIDCAITMTITEKISDDEYKGNINIISKRPVYKSGYSACNLINHTDNDIQFKYIEFQPLEFSISQHLNNLTSIYAYWAYVILAMDYDSFSLDGGTPYWQKAQTIVSNAQNAPEKGWKSMDSDKNRFWLVDNMLQPTYAPLRECNYKYHRLGLDVMYQDPNGGRAACLDALQLLDKVYDARPLSFPLQFFFNAKVDEVVQMFKGGSPEEKTKSMALLQKIDAGHGLQYQKINQN